MGSSLPSKFNAERIQSALKELSPYNVRLVYSLVLHGHFILTFYNLHQYDFTLNASSMLTKWEHIDVPFPPLESMCFM